jgi:hypothetical protein
VRVVKSAHPPRGGPEQDHSGLRAQQIWLSDAVTELDESVDAARMLTPGPRLTPAERLQIYRDAYRGRLVECLADDYPAVRYMLGKAAFETIAHAYIDRHPSRSPSLNAFGRWFSAFLAARDADIGTFPAELAQLEWAIVEAIHAASSPPLTLERLERVTPEQWPTAVLVPAASVRVLRYTHPVDSFYQAFRNDEHPTVPAAALSATLVHRRGWVVWRSELTPAMARLLEAIGAGSPLGEALASSVGGEDPGAQASVTRWFQEWVSSGVFTAVELPAP